MAADVELRERRQAGQLRRQRRVQPQAVIADRAAVWEASQGHQHQTCAAAPAAVRLLMPRHGDAQISGPQILAKVSGEKMVCLVYGAMSSKRSESAPTTRQPWQLRPGQAQVLGMHAAAPHGSAAASHPYPWACAVVISCACISSNAATSPASVLLALPAEVLVSRCLLAELCNHVRAAAYCTCWLLTFAHAELWNSTEAARQIATALEGDTLFTGMACRPHWLICRSLGSRELQVVVHLQQSVIDDVYAVLAHRVRNRV